MMVLATALIGYRFTRRVLLPVRRITGTVKEIRSDADLSRRVGLTGADNGRAPVHRDEFYALAETFDGMLESWKRSSGGNSSLHPMHPMNCVHR